MDLWSYPGKRWNSVPIFVHIGILILSLQILVFSPYLFFQTMEFWLQFYKDWNNDLILPNIWILAFFFIHNGILTSSFETMEFWLYCYKHLPLILSFHCNNWNSCPILPNINLNSAPIFIQFGILTSSFRTLQFWPYLYTHWSSYLIVLNLGIRALFLCTFTHWRFDLILENIAILALSCYT